MALPHATIHMHPAGGGARGYAPDVEIQYKELKRMQDLLHNILAKHTGQTVARIAEDFDRDYFMDPTTAVEYGIIDEVLTQERREEKPAEEKKEGLVMGRRSIPRRATMLILPPQPRRGRPADLRP